MMQAVICNGFGNTDVLSLQSVAKPTLKANEILVRVFASALNRADILQRKGFYPPPVGESEILGLEIAGEVAEIGSEVKHHQIGDKVFGLVSGGGYAEYCCIDAEMAMKMPTEIDFIHAAAIPEAFFTAQETVFVLGELKKNESILIHAGASGVGTAAVQMAKTIGATVYFTAGTDEKIQRVLTLGADAGINYKTEDFYERIMTLTHQEGVDVVEDFVGGDYFAKHLQLLKINGRLIIVAYMNGAQANIDLKLIQKKRLQIKGSALRIRPLEEKREVTKRFIKNWLPLIENKIINSVVDKVFSIDKVAEAHQYLESNQNVGKVVLQIV